MQKQSSMSLWDEILLWAKRSLTFQKCKPQCRNPNSIHQHHLYYQLFTFQIFFHFSSTPCSQDNKILRKMLFMFWSPPSQNDPPPTFFVDVVNATWEAKCIYLSWSYLVMFSNLLIGKSKSSPQRNSMCFFEFDKMVTFSKFCVVWLNIPKSHHTFEVPSSPYWPVLLQRVWLLIHPFTHSQIYIMLADYSLYSIPKKSFWYCPSFNFYFFDYSANHWGY